MWHECSRETLVILSLTVAEFFHSLQSEVVLRTFVQYLIAFYNRPEAASDGMSSRRLIVPDKRLKIV